MPPKKADSKKDNKKEKKTAVKKTAKTSTVKKAATSKNATVAKKTATSKKTDSTKKATTAKKANTSKKSSATKKSTTSKKTVVKKSVETKKTGTAKKAVTTKETAEKKVSTTKKAVTDKATKSTKKSSPGKKSSAVVRKKSTAKKTTAHRKSVSAKRTPKKSSKKEEKLLVKDFPLTEYYDLPEKYTETVVKVLAQTPDTLFIYWDISNEDRKRFEDIYGPSFFSDTKPVLIITNKTMHYTFEIDINDFANCWYLHVNDAKCDYSIELGRRPISNISIPNNYLYISSSNTIEAPNDHILLEKKQSMVYFRNVKTNVITSKPITSLSFLKNLGKFYDIYEFYDRAYSSEDFSEAGKLMGNSSSVMK